jgi:hypothetical protein
VARWGPFRCLVLSGHVISFCNKTRSNKCIGILCLHSDRMYDNLILGIHTMSIWFWSKKTGCDTWPPHCLPSSGEWTIGFPVFHSPSPAPWPAPLDTGVARGQALVSSVPPSMGSPRWTMAGHGPQAMDRVYRLFNTKIIWLIQGNSSFTNNPLPFSIINP